MMTGEIMRALGPGWRMKMASRAGLRGVVGSKVGSAVGGMVDDGSGGGKVGVAARGLENWQAKVDIKKTVIR